MTDGTAPRIFFGVELTLLGFGDVTAICAGISEILNCECAIRSALRAGLAPSDFALTALMADT